MTSADPELLVESLSMLLYTVIAAALTGGGVVAEYAGLQHMGAGDATVGLWLAAMGGLMLYAGVYGVGYRKVLVRVAAAIQ